jgi:uncharacterized repeat protein (TIGR03833 family)
MDGKTRAHITPGVRVKIVLKQDQRTGKLTEGVVSRILTKAAVHPRGIKVQLTDGQVGRVQHVVDLPPDVLDEVAARQEASPEPDEKQ